MTRRPCLPLLLSTAILAASAASLAQISGGGSPTNPSYPPGASSGGDPTGAPSGADTAEAASSNPAAPMDGWSSSAGSNPAQANLPAGDSILTTTVQTTRAIGDRFKSLSDTIANELQQLTILQTQRSGLQTQLDAKKKALATDRAKQDPDDKTRAEMAELQRTIDQLSGMIAALDKKIANLQDALRKDRAGLDVMRSRIEAVRQSLQRALAASEKVEGDPRTSSQKKEQARQLAARIRTEQSALNALAKATAAPAASSSVAALPARPPASPR